MSVLVETGIILTEKGHSDQPAIECGSCSGYTARSTLECLKCTYPKSSDESWIDEKMSLWIQNKSRDTRKDGLACYESALCNSTENGVVHRLESKWQPATPVSKFLALDQYNGQFARQGPSLSSNWIL